MIDWQRQWELHAPGFRSGRAHIDIKPFGTVKLLPGAGFGDFSHPTTRLTLGLMKEEVQKREVLDIGCGSGILSIAAKKMGADKVMGIDIDPEAILHSQNNAKENGLDIFYSEVYSYELKEPVVLINMIQSEQQKVLQAYPFLLEKSTTWIASGILSEQKQIYVEWMHNLGFRGEKEVREGDWSAFVFLKN